MQADTAELLPCISLGEAHLAIYFIHVPSVLAASRVGLPLAWLALGRLSVTH